MNREGRAEREVGDRLFGLRAPELLGHALAVGVEGVDRVVNEWIDNEPQPATRAATA